jgi:predicted dehydrogenase
MLRRITARRIKPLSYTYFYSSYVEEQRHFFECLRNGKEPAVGARDAFGTVRLIEDVYSVSAGRPVGAMVSPVIGGR